MTASNARVAGREHIPLYPKGFIALRIVQLVLALFVLALASYGVSLLAFDGDIFIMVVVSQHPLLNHALINIHEY